MSIECRWRESAVADGAVAVGGIGTDLVPGGVATVGIRIADQVLAFRIFTTGASIGQAAVTGTASAIAIATGGVGRIRTDLIPFRIATVWVCGADRLTTFKIFAPRGSVGDEAGT